MADEHKSNMEKGYWSHDSAPHNGEGTSNTNRGSIDFQLKPRITVVGVGGAGGNAVNNMIAKNLEGVDFIVANTDAQSLAQSRTERRIQLGIHTTEGLGAGARPEIGRAAAEEALEAIQSELAGSHMAFITAGMGGGTGTGGAPVVARAAREMGILTVGVVTKPFHFEGVHRMRLAEAGMEELAHYVDTLIIIPNQNLFRVANEHTTFAQAFNMADDVLYAGVRGVTDLIIMPGLINLDFADIRTVMSEMGKAMMGTGEAEGDKRALDAAEAAISNPLLDDTSMKGARGVLINITGGPDMTLYEVDEAANRIRDEVDPDANIIFGSTFDERLEGRIRVSVVATGIDSEAQSYASNEQQRSTAQYAAVDTRDSIRSSSVEGDSIRARRDILSFEEQETLLNSMREQDRPGFERFIPAEQQVERQIVFANRQVSMRPEEAFIPAPALDPRDPSGRSVARTGKVDSRIEQQDIRSGLVDQRSRIITTHLADEPRSYQRGQNIISPPYGTTVTDPPRRSQTLLEKVAGIGRIRRTAEPTPRSEQREMPNQPTVVDPPVKTVSKTDYGDPANTPEEDLDIPAFLRRQIN